MYANTLTTHNFNFRQIVAKEEGWTDRLERVITDYATDPSFDNVELARKLLVSERNLFRKVKRATGYSPNQYIQKYRLQLAMDHLINGKYRTVNETANAIGYVNVSYFISVFEKEYGKTPLTVLQENGWR